MLLFFLQFIENFSQVTPKNDTERSQKDTMVSMVSFLMKLCNEDNYENNN